MSENTNETEISKAQTAQPSSEAAGYMPWNRQELIGWSIVGMNHYHVKGARYLFCAMTKGDICITAEGGYEHEVFDELARKAEDI